jgi:hypothetical protein
VNLILNSGDRAHLEMIAAACQHEKFMMWWRSPHKRNADDNQKQDDYWGLLAAFYHVRSAFAHHFYVYAETTGWYIDIQRPYEGSHHASRAYDIDYYFDRFPGFRIFVKMCSRPTAPHLVITWREHIEMFFVSLWKVFKMDTSDGCIRDYCFFSVVARESAICKPLAQWWEQRARKKYGSVGLSFSDYFKSLEHPLIEGDWPCI